MGIIIDFKDKPNLLNFDIVNKRAADSGYAFLEWEPVQNWITCTMPSKHNTGNIGMVVPDWFFSISIWHCLRDSSKWKNNGNYTPRYMWRELITLNS